MPSTRKGKRRTALIRLNTTSRENPTILKGNKMSHTKGNRKSITKAVRDELEQRLNNKLHLDERFRESLLQPLRKLKDGSS
jgi:hypothetical protein